MNKGKAAFVCEGNWVGVYMGWGTEVTSCRGPCRVRIFHLEEAKMNKIIFLCDFTSPWPHLKTWFSDFSQNWSKSYFLEYYLACENLRILFMFRVQIYGCSRKVWNVRRNYELFTLYPKLSNSSFFQYSQAFHFLKKFFLISQTFVYKTMLGLWE